jgi:indole-3-acetate monooxygenase
VPESSRSSSIAAAELQDELLGRVRDLEPLLRKHADENERQRHLADAVVDALRMARLFHMITPRALGGLSVELMTFYRIIERLAAIDGSTAWCVMINGGCPLTGAFLPETSAQAIYGASDAIGSGTFFPFGRAERVRGGYRVRGRWPYASGSWHSNWHFAACLVYESDAEEPLPGPNGQPMVIAPHIPRSEVRLIDTWDVSGLAGSGSHDVEIDAFVDDERTWHIGASEPNALYRDALYRVPFMAVFAWPIAAVALGIARGAIDSVIGVAQRKRQVATGVPLIEQPLFQLQIAQATAKLESARAWLYQRLEDMWQKANLQQAIPPSERALGLLAATNATQQAAAAVEIAYRAGGASANFRHSSLQRALRDVNAATQHAATAPAQLLAAGGMLLGLPAQNPMLLL